MGEIRRLEDAQVDGKRVLVRAELNAPITKGRIEDDSRLRVVCGTLKLCFEKGASKVIVLGKLGRPKGEYIEELSQKPLVTYFSDCMDQEVGFVEYKPFDHFAEVVEAVNVSDSKLVLLENTRFWPQEESNDEEFAKMLASMGDIYVNECFGVSHRSEASLVGIPKFLPSFIGVQFGKEIDNLSKVLVDPAHPVVTLLSGAKEDKLDYLDDFIRISDKVLVAGLLPTILGEDYSNDKVVLARLIQDKGDITKHTIEDFSSIVAKAGTIVLSGPLGKFEEEGYRQGTREVFQDIASSSAFKIAGGGDTGRAIKMFDLQDKFDFVSTGGGAMLEYLAKGTLPAIEALVK